MKKIQEIYDDFKNSFDQNDISATYCEIDGKHVKEIINANYEFRFEENKIVLEKIIKAATKNDKKERTKLLNKIQQQLDRFSLNINTRQVAISEKFDDKDFPACISFIHIFVRTNILHMNVYVRSQNIDNNFLYDNQTFMQIADFVSFYLILNNICNIQDSLIHVFIGSLHRISDKI